MTDLQLVRKKLIVEQLKKTPIVQVACEKVDVSRATYYRWRTEDTEFKKASDLALREGFLLINDMAESQLLSAIRDKHMTAIIYWLKHHHPLYESRLAITHKQDHEYELTEEEKAIVEQALALVSSTNKEPHADTHS